MTYEEFVESLNNLNAPNIEVKNQAYEELYLFENNPNQWELFAQLIQSDDEQEIFYGLKFAENLLLEHSAIILQEIEPLITRCKQLVQAPNLDLYIIKKASEVLFYISFFGLSDFQELISFYMQLEDTKVVANCLSQSFEEMRSCKIQGIPRIIIQEYNELLLEFYASPLFSQFATRISSADDALAISGLLVCAAASEKGVVEFVFENMAFCEPRLLSQRENDQFFAQLVKIAANCEGFGFIGAGIGRYVELFQIIRAVCVNIQENTVPYATIKEIPQFIKSCVFGIHFPEFAHFALEQIPQPLKSDSEILYKQRNAGKMKDTVYSCICELLLALFSIYEISAQNCDQNTMISVLEAILHIEQLKMEKGIQKYMATIQEHAFTQFFDGILGTIQRPQEILYYKNEFGEVVKQRIEEENLIELNQAQLLVLTSITGRFNLFSSYEQELLSIAKLANIHLIQQLSYTFPAISQAGDVKYVKNPKFRESFVQNTLSLYLTLADAISMQEDKIIAIYCSIYVAEKSVSFLSDQLKCSFILKAFGYLQCGIPEVVEAANELLIALFQVLLHKNTIADSEFDQILFQIYPLSMEYLDEFEIKDLYSVLCRNEEQNELGILLFPVQEQFQQLVQEMNCIKEDDLLTDESINEILQGLQILNACCEELNKLIISDFVEPIISEIQEVWFFYFGNEQSCSYLVQSVIRLVYEILKNIKLKLDKEKLDLKYGQFIELIISSEEERLELMCESNQELLVESIQFLDLLDTAELFPLFDTCFNQIVENKADIEVINQFMELFIRFYENGATIYQQLAEEEKSEMLEIFIAITTNQEFLTNYSEELLDRFAETINYCIIRRSGQEFANEYLLYLIESKFVVSNDFVINCLQQLKGVLGENTIISTCQQGIPFFNYEVVQAVLEGNSEAVDDLRILCE